MAEVGCLKDGHFQNLSCEGNIILDGGAVHTGASTLQDVRVSGILSLGPDPQTEGVFSAKIDTGLVNGPKIFTTPDPGTGNTSPITDGDITMTKELFAKGYIIGTATSASSKLNMPAASVFVTLFGPNRKVGDSFIYRIHNKAGTFAENLVWTADGDNNAQIVGETKIPGGSLTNLFCLSVGTFMCRLASLDGSTIHYRLS